MDHTLRALMEGLEHDSGTLGATAVWGLRPERGALDKRQGR